jgi:hypothetical protein
MQKSREDMGSLLAILKRVGNVLSPVCKGSIGCRDPAPRLLRALSCQGPYSFSCLRVVNTRTRSACVGASFRLSFLAN